MSEVRLGDALIMVAILLGALIVDKAVDRHGDLLSLSRQSLALMMVCASEGKYPSVDDDNIVTCRDK